MHYVYYLWHRYYIGWVVVKVLVSLQKLLLSETLVTLITSVGFLVRVDQHMRFKMSLKIINMYIHNDANK